MKQYGIPDYIIVSNPAIKYSHHNMSLRELQTVSPLTNMIAERTKKRGYLFHPYKATQYEILAHHVLTDPEFNHSLIGLSIVDTIFSGIYYNIMHTQMTQLKTYIQNNDVNSLVDLLKHHPSILSFPLDGPDNSRKNEEIIGLIEIITTAAKQQADILQPLLEYNPSILQAIDSDECSVLQAMLENKLVKDIEPFLEMHRQFSIEYMQPHDQLLCFILVDKQHFDLCLSLIKQYPHLATISNLTHKNLLHYLCMHISTLELSIQQPSAWKVPASIVRFARRNSQTIDKKNEFQSEKLKILAQSYDDLIECLLTTQPQLATQLDCNGSPPIHYTVYRDSALFETLFPHSQSVLNCWDIEEGSLVDLALQYATLPRTLNCLVEKLPKLVQQVPYVYMRNYTSSDDPQKNRVLLHYIELNSTCQHLFHPLIQFVLRNDFTLFIKIATLYPHMQREVDVRGNSLIHTINTVHAWQWVCDMMPDTIELQNNAGQTLAHRCGTCSAELLQQTILDCPALLHMADHLGRLPIHTLANHPEHIRIILMHDKTASNKKDAYGRTLIDYANSHTLIKVQLLSYNAITLDHIEHDIESWFATAEWDALLQQRNDLYYQQNQQGDTLTHILCKNIFSLPHLDNQTVLDFLLSLDPRCFKVKNYVGYYPLQYLLTPRADLSEKLISLIKLHHSPLHQFTGSQGTGLLQLQSYYNSVDVFSPFTTNELQRLINHRDDAGNTVLHNNIDHKLSTNVLKHYPDLLQYINQYGESILHYQMRSGVEEVAMKIIEQVPTLIHHSDHQGRLPIHFSQSARVSRAMLDQDPELLFAVDHQGRNWCHYGAAVDGIVSHKDFAILLQQPDLAGNLPLHFLIQHCHDLGELQWRIETYPQALISPNHHGILPIMNIGDRYGQEAVLKFLSLKAPNTVNMIDIDGCNIAHYQTKILLWHPKLASQMDKLGRYAVHTATQRHRICELEFYRDFAPHCLILKDQQGQNILHFAVQDRCSMPYSYESIQHELQLSRNCDEDQFYFNLRKKTEQTELIDFIINMYPEMLTQTDDNGLKPIDLANENSRNHLVWLHH